MRSSICDLWIYLWHGLGYVRWIHWPSNFSIISPSSSQIIIQTFFCIFLRNFSVQNVYDVNMKKCFYLKTIISIALIVLCHLHYHNLWHNIYDIKFILFHCCYALVLLFFISDLSKQKHFCSSYWPKWFPQFLLLNEDLFKSNPE